MPLSLEDDLPTLLLERGCNLVIRGGASPGQRHEVSKIIMSSIDIHPVTFSESFTYFLNKSFYRKVFYFDPLILSFIILWV